MGKSPQSSDLNNTNIIIPSDNSRELDYSRPFSSRRGSSIEGIIGAWLNEVKQKRSQSAKTEKCYRMTINAFRAFLQRYNKDLLYEDENFVEEIADLAQAFSGLRYPGSNHTGAVSKATTANRLTILSSFYGHAIKRRHVPANTANPISLVDRPTVKHYAKAHALPQEQVSAALDSIEDKTLEGLRDLVLLLVLLSTGKRVSEISGIRKGDLTNGERIEVIYPHAKGDKKLSDLLDSDVSGHLQRLLELCYSGKFWSMPDDTPVWITVRKNPQSNPGDPLKYQGVRGIVKKYLGTTKVHVTRHTFASFMQQVNAKLEDIQHALGHDNVATTNEYLQEITVHSNPHTSAVVDLLGIRKRSTT